MICAAPGENTGNVLADWMELEVLASTTDSAPLVSINEALEIEEDEEPDELDEENLLAESRLQRAVAAIRERSKLLGSAYPFEVDATGTRLTLSKDLTDGAYAYLFCLIVSTAAKGGPLSGSGPWAPDLRNARELFQICATVAIAGHVRGPAFSVGWPRPDASGFLEKLKTVYAHMGDGKVHDKMPPGAPAQVKDDEIDVIAWQDCGGSKPCLGYFLGQAASGGDWTEKSLKGRPDVFHGTWFATSPAAAHRVGTVIPFVVPSEADAEPDDAERQDEIDGQVRRLALTHGDLIHRHRVARYLQDGLALHAAGTGPIERVADVGMVVAYVASYRTQLQGAAAVEP